MYRVEDSNIILRGTEQEAPSAILKGTLVLCLSEPLAVKGIRLRFTGERRLAYALRSPSDLKSLHKAYCNTVGTSQALMAQIM